MYLFIAEKLRFKRSGNFPGHRSKRPSQRNIPPVVTAITWLRWGRRVSGVQYHPHARFMVLMSLKGQISPQKINVVQDGTPAPEGITRVDHSQGAGTQTEYRNHARKKMLFNSVKQQHSVKTGVGSVCKMRHCSEDYYG